MAKPKNRLRQQSRSGTIWLLLLLIGLSIIAGLFFADYREVPYGWFISLFWLTAAAFACAFGVIYYAQFVLPHHEGENWLEGVAMMLRAATHFETPPQASQRSIRSSKLAAPATDELSSSFNSLNAGMVRSHQVLAVGKGASFARPAGPGFVRLQSGERPIQLIDLRLHVRSAEATANTRDGIPLDTKVSVVFQVKQSERDHAGVRLEYPYDKSAIFWVTQLNSFDGENNVRPWSEQLAPQAVTYMISEIAQFMLDELWQDPAIFIGIQERVRRQLRGTFDEWGIKVISVKVSPQKLPERIAAQRIENWRAPWQSQIAAQTAAGNAEALRRIKLARARAQVEIIEKIMQSIEEMRATEQASLPEIVTLRVIDVLEEAATRSTAQAYLPSQVLANLTLSPSRDSAQVEGDDSDG